MAVAVATRTGSDTLEEGHAIETPRRGIDILRGSHPEARAWHAGFQPGYNPPRSIEVQITRLSASAVPEAGEIQARAFFDDPAFTFTFPDDAARRQRLPWLMGIGVGYGSRFGDVLTTAGSMLGHAVWLPPGETSLSEERMGALGFDEAPARMGEDALKRFGQFMELASSHHERLVPTPHWYLLILGVEPERQGQGIGSALIMPNLARADAEGLPCYLETAKERNVMFYRRHGFEVRDEEHIPGGPKVWMMVRQPGQRGTAGA